MPVKKSNQMCQANRKIINKTESFKKNKKRKEKEEERYAEAGTVHCFHVALTVN